MKRILLVTAVSTILAAGAGASAYAQSAQNPPPPPNNTRTNQQGGTTADDQSQAKADLAITQKIRQAIIKDKTLSTDAHNCKVVTQKGAVTLRGPVKSDDEKKTVGQIAMKIAGDDKVTNELTIKPKKSKA